MLPSGWLEHSEFEGTSSRVFDLAKMPAFYKGEPFYVVCFYTDPELSFTSEYWSVWADRGKEVAV